LSEVLTNPYRFASAVSPTLEFDFTDDTGWQFNNAYSWITETGGGTLNIKCSKDGVKEAAVYPFSLDSITLETKWVLRAYDMNWTNGLPNYGQALLGFTDLGKTESEAQNHWGVAGLFFAGSEGGQYGAYLNLEGWTDAAQYEPNEVKIVYPCSAPCTPFQDNDPLWVELAMNEGTLTSKVFDNDDFDSTPVATNTNSTYTAEQSTNTTYLSLKNFAVDLGEVGFQMQLSIGGLKFWNGVSEV